MIRNKHAHTHRHTHKHTHTHRNAHTHTQAHTHTHTHTHTPTTYPHTLTDPSSTHQSTHPTPANHHSCLSAYQHIHPCTHPSIHLPNTHPPTLSPAHQPTRPHTHSHTHPSMHLHFNAIKSFAFTHVADVYKVDSLFLGLSSRAGKTEDQICLCRLHPVLNLYYIKHRNGDPTRPFFLPKWIGGARRSASTSIPSFYIMCVCACGRRMCVYVCSGCDLHLAGLWNMWGIRL